MIPTFRSQPGRHLLPARFSLSLALTALLLPLLSALPASAQAIATSNLGASQVTLRLTSPTTGTGSFTILTASATCGTATQTVNGQDNNGTAAYRRGSLALTANVAGSYTVRNLAQDTAYTACFTPDGTTAPSTLAFSTHPTTLPGSANWTQLGPIDFSNGGAVGLSMAIAPDGSPWVSYEDFAHGSGATVMHYSGGAWSAVGGPNFSPDIAYSTSFAFSPGGIPSVVFVDYGNGDKLSLMQYSGGAWNAVGGFGFSQGKGYLPSLTFGPDGSPYVAYTDGGSGGTDDSLRVMHYSGGTWSQVGSDFTGGGRNPSLAFAPDGTPYVAYVSDVTPSVLSVKRYTAGAWTEVGPTNVAVDEFCTPSLAFSPNGIPYVAFSANGNQPSVTVIQYTSNNWSTVGASNFTAGAVQSTSLSFAPDNTPFVAFANGNGQKMTVMHYSASASSWSLVGSSGFSAGQAGYFTSAFSPDGSPYVIYEDGANHDGLTAMDIQASVPSLTLTPSSIVFPPTAVGSVSAYQTATLSYTGTSAVYLNTPTLTDSTDFTQSDNCNGMVTANSSCTITFAFTPQTSGTLTSTYSIADLNNQSSPLTVVLSGPATGGYGLTISPASITFPSTAVGATSAPQTATLTLHGGSTRVSLTSGSLTNSTDFTQTDNCGGIITPNGSCTVTFTFKPQSIGTLSSAYSIGQLGGSSPVTVTLSGDSTGTPQAVFSPTSLSFTTVVGALASAQTVTLTNPGTATLTINSLSLSGTNAAQFSLGSNTCSSALAAGSSCTIPVNCITTAYGSYGASLVLSSNASSASVALGCNVNGTSTATLTPFTGNFGSILPGTATAATVFTLSNTGNIPLLITSVTLTGANATSFNTTANTCGASLAVGANCSISVAFAPTGAGSFSAALTVTDTAGVQTAGVTGAAAYPIPPDFTLTAAPTTQSSYRGQSATYTLQLASLLASNPFNSPVTLSVTGIPADATASFSPATVTPGSSRTASQLTISVPTLAARQETPSSNNSMHLAVLPLAALLIGLPFRRRKTATRFSRLLPTLILILLGGITSMLSGCGSGTGFAPPLATYTLTVTGTGAGTSGSITHTTTVTLIVK